MHPKNTISSLLLVLLPLLLTAQADPLVLPPPDLGKLLAEDAAAEHARFAAPVVLKPAPAPAPEEYVHENGEWVWSREITLAGATGLSVIVTELNLPDYGRLELTNAAGRRGPFTQADASAQNRLFTGFLPGERVRLTYRGPLPDTAPFRLHRVDHVYRPDRWAHPLNKDFGDSNECHVNANCAAGDGWADEKSGAGRINLVVLEGVGFCSGNLINNTARDGRPLLLTGFHCMDGFTPLYDLWSVDFGYTAAGCDNPAAEPAFRRYAGVRFRAGWRDTDFMLLEITDNRFVAEDHFFAGWDRTDGDVPGRITAFHHPFGDIQKVGQSAAAGMPILNNRITWNSNVVTPPRHHFRMIMTLGTFQVGSSGSGFFDEAHRLRGTLNGGNAVCPGDSEAFIGRLHLSWLGGGTDSTSLAPWLDPLGAAPETLDGANLITKRFVSGQVLSASGQPVAGARVQLAWLPADSVVFVTDDRGFFRGERPPNVEAFLLSGSFQEDGPLELGVDVFDVLNIRRHLLGLDTLAPERRLAADVNGSGTVRVSDISRIVRVILGIGDWGERPNWLLLPFGYPLEPLPPNPGAPIPIALNQLSIHDLQISFYVLKTGDTDGSAE